MLTVFLTSSCFPVMYFHSCFTLAELYLVSLCWIYVKFCAVFHVCLLLCMMKSHTWSEQHHFHCSRCIQGDAFWYINFIWFIHTYIVYACSLALPMLALTDPDLNFFLFIFVSKTKHEVSFKISIKTSAMKFGIFLKPSKYQIKK